MTAAIEFSAEAEDELDAAAVWFDEQRPGLGREFVGAVDAALELVAKWPGTGAVVDDVPAEFDVRRAPVSRFRFHVAYLVNDGRLRVLAVAHDHRKPGYWLDRLGT